MARPWLPFASAAVALAAIAWLLLADQAIPGADGTFPITVQAPQEQLFAGEVEVRGATAYTVLLAAASQGGFEVEATGSGDRLLVVRIGDHRNEGAAGWCYAVWEDGWVSPRMSAGEAGLRDGQAVLWEYRGGGCPTLG